MSNPDNQDNKATAPKLIRYLIRKKHWSPFEMVNACVKVETTRDISHQLIRHRSFSFQEFSGRYAAYDHFDTSRECRMQDSANRQNSLSCDDPDILSFWDRIVKGTAAVSKGLYEASLQKGIAKEVARSLLPEGLVSSTIYINGTIRSWIHYWAVRCTPETQKEHRLVAEATQMVILERIPEIASCLR